MRVAINGLGRMGRAVLKAVSENPEFELVALNDIISAENLAFLLKYDTVHGKYDKNIEFGTNMISVDGKSIMIFNQQQASCLPWKKLDIDIVFECSGLPQEEALQGNYNDSGAKFVIFSSPIVSGDITNIVEADEKEFSLSCSCRYHNVSCASPIVELISSKLGINKAAITTNNTLFSDNLKSRKKFDIARNGSIAEMNSLSYVEEPRCSVADLLFLTRKKTDEFEINNILEQESLSDKYNDFIEVARKPVNNLDTIKEPRPSIIDLTMTHVIDGDLVKLISWFDNEWGCARQMCYRAGRIAESLR
jgi:glyceraldehyde 3-phosphate dehydrogenase